MGNVKINQDKCKGCSLCVNVCPKKILQLDTNKVNPKGYNPCSCIDTDACIGCAFCATICPDVVIEVFR